MPTSDTEKGPIDGTIGLEPVKKGLEWTDWVGFVLATVGILTTIDCAVTMVSQWVHHV